MMAVGCHTLKSLNEIGSGAERRVRDAEKSVAGLGMGGEVWSGLSVELVEVECKVGSGVED